MGGGNEEHEGAIDPEVLYTKEYCIGSLQDICSDVPELFNWTLLTPL